ncbi:cyclin-dependent kinase inhibitor 7-like isoform X2 [Carica papaya]|uniref:cyclin-dependent kinase inhibitor 7-like isoform X2 n=1 Tax=Carica papaya TaxID=3649 RepID=UPI000B8CE92E|nr:cyclin-dependent kinase inhibitor 7-like isoform X2 [Carica papaya]
MGDSVSNSKRSAKFAEIETSMSGLPCKRTKSVGSTDTELKNPRSSATSSDKEISPAISPSSRRAFAAETAGEHCSIVSSDCSTNESCEILKDGLRSVDLQSRSFETEIPTCITNKFSRETTPTSEICGDTAEMDSTAKNLPVTAKDQRRRLPAAKMPSQAEIDEFFSVAEKYEQKRFSDKYNYDVVNDAPLEGRYQWLPLKP